MKSKLNVTQVLRHVVQAAAFLFFPGLFFSIFTALRDIVTALVAGTFSFAALAGDIALLVIAFGITALWGRFFCGYLCSFGAMQELVGWISKKLLPKLRRIPSKADRMLKYVKYGVLALIVVLLWIVQLPADSSFSPWGVFGMLVSGNLSVMGAAIPTLGFVLLVAILVGSFFVERFFCRYLCPLGALFALTSKGRLYKIKRKESACTNCGLCSRSCAMGLTVPQGDAVCSGECIDCMRCIGACHTEALKGTPHPAVAGTAAALALCGLVSVGQIATESIGSEQISDDPALSAYAAEPETETTEEEMPEQYLSADRTHHGRHSRGSASVQEPALPEIETTDPADGTAPSAQAEIPTETEPAAQAETPAETEPASQPETSAAQTESGYADGVYTGSGTGLRGTTQVQVTVENGKITDITVLSYQDDRQYFSRAQSSMIAAILNAQSIDVSTVSGATFSSNSILEAVADALDIDFTNPNAGTSGHGRH